jgi:hypothetical protein
MIGLYSMVEMRIPEGNHFAHESSQPMTGSDPGPDFSGVPCSEGGGDPTVKPEHVRQTSSMAVADRREPQPEFFVRYLREAAKWLSVVDLKHRGAAIERSKAPLQALDGVAMVSALCACLDGPWWQQEASSRGRNWVWRDKVPPYLTESREVALERRLAQRSSERWTCQMSTSSGLRLGVRDSRRAIDIVQRSQENEYRFIELKVGSDQPLYATFEVLGYGLLYLLARQHGRRGDGRHDVMAASRIELVVLGPDSWFSYKESSGGPVSRFGFESLQERINEGLAAEVRARGCDGLNEMSLRFVVFHDTPTIEDDVTAIEALFSPELRTGDAAT